MDIKYVTSKCVPVADCLRRLINAKSAQEDESLNLQITNLGVEPVNIDWDNIRRFRMLDPTLVRLARVIQNGWPEHAKELEDDVKVYFPYRFILHIVNGIIFLQNRIVVPVGLRCSFLDKLHDNHMGIVKTRLLARTLILAKLAQGHRSYLQCVTCKENMNMPPNTPTFAVKAGGPGEVYGMDVADINGK